MEISIGFMRRRLYAPYQWAVLVKPSHREPATIDSWHDTKKEARARRTELRSVFGIPYKLRQFAHELLP